MFCLWFGLEPKFQKRDLVKIRQKLAFTLSQGIPPLWISECVTLSVVYLSDRPQLLTRQV